MRIISICPSNTELATYLELDSHLVGVDDYSDWPNNVHSLPKLGPDLSINMEKVEDLKPDLVLASLSVPGMERNVEELKKRNIPYVTFNPNSLTDVADDLIKLGKYTGKEKKAQQVVEKYYTFIHDYRQKASTVLKKTSIYWEWWPKPIFTPGKTNWLTEVSSLSGGYNIFSKYNKPNVQTEWEEVVSFKPEHICMAWVGVKTSKMNPETIKKRKNASNVPAIQQNNIHVLEEELYCRPSPRLLLGVKQLAAILHPDTFLKYDARDPLL